MLGHGAFAGGMDIYVTSMRTVVYGDLSQVAAHEPIERLLFRFDSYTQHHHTCDGPASHTVQRPDHASLESAL